MKKAEAPSVAGATDWFGGEVSAEQAERLDRP